MGSFDGKVVIVTGGAKGIGKATALEFAREGAKIAIADVDGAAGNTALEQIREYRQDGLVIEANLALSADCQRIVADTVDAFGGIDILVNNVGINSPDTHLNVENMSEEIWDRVLDINLKSYFLMSKYAIPEIRKKGVGVIINMASVHGLQSAKLAPAYAASKGAILSLTRQMSLDYASDNIRVLAVCPGAIDTPLNRTIAAQRPGDPDETIRRWGSAHPLGRIGTGEDIANVVLFLASDKASWMTGEYVCVDGGIMAQGAWANVEDANTAGQSR